MFASPAVLVCCWTSCTAIVLAQAPPAPDKGLAPPAEAPPGLTRLTKDYEVWADLKRKLVVVGGQVCLREGLLEMFACPRGTKEHESIVSLNSKAR